MKRSELTSNEEAILHDGNPLSMKQHALDALMQWYSDNCNGEWEHQYGIEIVTLDNPGWSFNVDLAETKLAGVPFITAEHQMESNASWWRCWKEGDLFHAACGASDLATVIGIFIEWADTRR